MERRPGKPQIIRFDALGSTNDHAADLARKGPSVVAEGTCVWALEQTHGRGRHGAVWESEPGKNLTFSVIYYPAFLTSDTQFLLSSAVALGIADSLKPYVAGVSVKWPNDIYVGDRKIAGILIEHSVSGKALSHTIVGIGLNVNQTTFLSDAPNPVSLKQVTGREHDLWLILNVLLTSLESRYRQLEDGDAESIRAEYHTMLYQLHRYRPYVICGKPVTAQITGVTPEGRLHLETKDGTLFLCGTKEVAFVHLTADYHPSGLQGGS